MEKIQVNMSFVVCLYENIRTCLFTRFPAFSPFSDRKGSIAN